MARRRELKGIASGLAQHCVSRNNDQGGYWALGLILKAAIEHQEYDFTVDIMSDAALRPELETFRRHFQEKFSGDECRLNEYISGFVVDFGIALHSYAGARKGIVEYRVTCRVHIVDDLGKSWTASAAAYCYPHDPALERRSTRAGKGSGK